MNLSDVADQVRGISYQPHQKFDQASENTIPLLRANNIKNFVLNNDDIYHVDNSIVKEKQHLRKGDVLIAASSGSKHIVGKAAYVENDQKVTFGAFCKILRPKKNIDSKYFRYFFETPYYRHTISSVVEGANINNLTARHLNELQIPLPPFTTQQKIAAALDKADAIRKRSQLILSKYDQLAQSVFLEMFGDPVKNEKGWEVKELKEVTSKIGSGATPRGGKEAYKTEGISLIRSLNIHDNLFKYKNLAFIDDAQAAKLNNVKVEENDVLFNITGASVCRCTIVPSDILPARVNQHVSILRPIKELSPSFLLYVFTSNNFKQKLLALASSGGATREAITKDEIEKINIPTPPFSLQSKFSTIIAQIEKQKSQTQRELNRAEKLYQSLLQQAFTGELFPETSSKELTHT